MRYAFITDIHEDIINLKQAFRKIEKNNIDEIICLGDISGFSAPQYNYLNTRNAHECLSLIRSNCSKVIIGNHDMHVAHIIPQNCTFFNFPQNWYLLDYQQRQQMGGNILWLHEEYDLNPLYKKDDLEYLKTLPEYSILNTPDFNILLSHYVFPNLSGLKREFYTYSDEFRQHFEYMHSLDCKISITGHSHIKGFFMAKPKSFKTYRYTKKELPEDDKTCIGIPPVTTNGNKSGICILDSADLSIQVLRI